MIEAFESWFVPVLFLAVMIAVVSLQFWAMFRYWHPVALELGVSFMDRSASRRVILRGISGGSSSLHALVARCRWAFAVSYAMFFVFIWIVLGTDGSVFLLACLIVSVVLSKPYNVEGEST